MDEFGKEKIEEEVPRFDGDIFAQSILQKEETTSISWKRHGGYKLMAIVKEFFCYKPRAIKEKDLNLEDTVKNLLGSVFNNLSKDVLDKCKELLQHQRMLEDTRARRRLEKWATRVISWYLIFVFIILTINGIATSIMRYVCLDKGIDNIGDCGFISDKIMIAILSTTTVNIIGLGLIVLKGHFQNKSDSNNIKKTDDGKAAE